MESNMRTKLIPVSLIYQDYWHLPKQEVCFNEMFPRQKEGRKKIIWLDPPGSWKLWISLVPQNRGGKKGKEFRPQQAANVLPKFHPQLPSSPQGLLFLYTSNVNKLMVCTPDLKTLALYLSLPNSSHPFLLSFPSSRSRSIPICFLLGVHFQSAGWWNLEFRPPQVMRVLGLLKVPSLGPCHLPLLPLPMPHSPLCNNMLEPTSVSNSMFIWTALGKWKLSLKAGVLKQQHEYK